ncbi:MAG: hypothetical protein NZO16_06980 [Deltaproteobacteria bacterium]|nr:hypothetical protein [Deltaproteobacteria bacterium]
MLQGALAFCTNDMFISILSFFEIVETGQLPQSNLFLIPSSCQDFLYILGLRLIGSSSRLEKNELDLSSHPDVLILDPAISVKDIKKSLSNLTLSPFLANKRIVIFKEFDECNQQVFNCMLKTLEEPPANVYFLMQSKNLSGIPKTILSRASLWLFRKDNLVSFMTNGTCTNYLEFELKKLVNDVDLVDRLRKSVFRYLRKGDFTHFFELSLEFENKNLFLQALLISFMIAFDDPQLETSKLRIAELVLKLELSCFLSRRKYLDENTLLLLSFASSFDEFFQMDLARF